MTALRQLDCVPLDARGLDFVRRRLSSANVLCTALREILDEVRGHVVAYAPFGIARERLHQFDAGGLLAENLDQIAKIHIDDDSTLVRVIDLFDEEFARLFAVLRADPGLSCIANDPMLTHESAEEYEAKFYVGAEGYHLVTGATPEPVAELALSAAPFWDRVNVIVTAPLSVDEGGNVQVEDLRAAVQSAMEVSCSAYDGEGYVVWKRAL